ncbi:MAG: hypothetical protein NDI60_11705 [Elusimicrobiales bacterium]|nr:hypothetical protein [Elusimicrobiales bacterium]
MNRKLVFWIGALALTVVPAVSVPAQEGPDEDGPEVEMMDEGDRPEMPMGGPGGGPGGPGFGPGMKAGRQQIMMKKKMQRGGGFGGPVGLSEEDTLAVIAKHDPAFAKKLEDLREAAPAKYKMVLQMSGKLFAVGRMEKDESIEKDAVRALALEFETKELSLKYGKAADSEKKAIKETLRAKLGELFDLKSRGQQLRVKHMEAEIGKLKKNLENRKANKSKIVEQRLEQMTGEGYGW